MAAGTVAIALAAVQLGIGLWSAWKGDKAAEEARDAEAERRRRMRELAIKKYGFQQAQASKNLSLVDRQDTRQRDIEKNVIFADMVKQKKIEGKILAHGGMIGKSSTFHMDKITGDLLRGREAIKEDFLHKRINTYFKKESVVDGLKMDKLNMEYGIAGLTPPPDHDKSLMYLQMVNSGLNAYGTYYKYTKPKADPNLGISTYTNPGNPHV
tara:strand:+ start:116 stop:748 length:633 start_codon:yes stop_codon:yes gene_type:complete